MANVLKFYIFLCVLQLIMTSGFAHSSLSRRTKFIVILVFPMCEYCNNGMTIIVHKLTLDLKIIKIKVQ